MRTLRGGNSNLQNDKAKKKNDDSEDVKSSVDDDVGANGDETTDDEGGVDTPPPPREEDEDSKGEDKVETEENKEKEGKNAAKKQEKEGKNAAKNQESDEYEVEQIVDMEVQKRKKCPVQFRIRWLGFTEKDDTWVPASDLNCEELVQEFLEISGRKSEYEKAFESKKRVAESSVEGCRQSARKTTKITYSELDEDQDEILPSGTRTRKIKTKAEKKQMPNFANSKKKKRKPNVISPGIKVNKKEEEFEVEKIVDGRMRGKVKDYKVRWKGFSSLHDSWIAESDLNCPNLVKAFDKKMQTNAAQDDVFEVEAIAGMRETKGRVEYKVRWKNWGPKYDSWLPEEELNCPEILNKFKKTLEKLEKEEDWQVEKIVDTRERRGKTEFLIHWKGFESKFDSWEPKENLSGCQDLLDKFTHQKEKEKDEVEVGSVERERKARDERPRAKRLAEEEEEAEEPKQRSRSKRKSNIVSYSEGD